MKTELTLSTATGSGFFAPVDTSLLGALLATHKRIAASIGAVDAFMQSEDCKSALGYYLKACREDQGRIGLNVPGLMQKGKAMAALHSDYWDKALRLTDVLECMPQVRRDEWYELIKKHETPPFEDEAVYLTPQELAELAVSYADIEDGMAVLEPSAGQGGIADYLPAGSMLVEVSALHCEILKEKGHSNVVHGDFLNLSLGKFDRIVMNPPFSDGRWQAHTEKAAGHLADDGVLVAIVLASAWQKYAIKGFDVDFMSKHDGAFDGTGVSVCIIRITRK